jgi:hypothetical protein
LVHKVRLVHPGQLDHKAAEDIAEVADMQVAKAILEDILGQLVQRQDLWDFQAVLGHKDQLDLQAVLVRFLQLGFLAAVDIQVVWVSAAARGMPVQLVQCPVL